MGDKCSSSTDQWPVLLCENHTFSKRSDESVPTGFQRCAAARRSQRVVSVSSFTPPLGTEEADHAPHTVLRRDLDSTAAPERPQSTGACRQSHGLFDYQLTREAHSRQQDEKKEEIKTNVW